MSRNLHTKMNLSYNDYIATVRRPYPPFLASVLLAGVSNRKHYQIVIRESFAISGMVLLDAVWYYRASEVKRAGEIALREWRQKGN